LSDEEVVSISVTAVPPEIGAKSKQFENVLGATKGPALEASNGGVFQPYEHRVIYWIQGIGAHEVRKFIQTNWRKLLNSRACLGYCLR
jgi:LGFP repeat